MHLAMHSSPTTEICLTNLLSSELLQLRLSFARNIIYIVHSNQVQRLNLPAVTESNHNSFICSVACKYANNAVNKQCLQCFDTVGWAAGRASGL